MSGEAGGGYFYPDSEDECCDAKMADDTTEGSEALGEALDSMAPHLLQNIRALAAPPAYSPLARAGSRSRRPDGTWSCIRDGVTEPCGDCDGCRHIAAINAMQPTGGRPDAAPELVSPPLVPYQIPSFQQPARIPLGNQLPHTSRSRPDTKDGA